MHVPGIRIQSDAAAAAARVALLLLLKQQCCYFLLLFVIVCRMANFVAGSLNMIPVFSFSSIKRFMPLNSTVAFAASICIYPR